jgi:hypothetical protein
VRLEPLRSLRPIDDLLGATGDPYHRRLLENFRELDPEGVMGTLSPEANADSKLLGEEFYTSGSGNPKALRKLAPGEIPGDWHALVKLSR